jgi:hypothetical protein
MLQVSRDIPDVREVRKGQHRDYSCPHQGLTLNFVDGQVIGHIGKKTLGSSQNKMLYLLVKKQRARIQGGWGKVAELEACLRPIYETEIEIVNGKKRIINRRKIKRSKEQKLESVQQAVYLLRVVFKEVHPECASLIECGIYEYSVAYRLAALHSCPVSPDCCSLVLKLPE